MVGRCWYLEICALSSLCIEFLVLVVPCASSIAAFIEVMCCHLDDCCSHSSVLIKMIVCQSLPTV